ncbi:universal stress protein [Microbispora sp. ATCC PTA-5024]|uniref:universal stress protein n=1 Tax=Microbispora sp. ATCC PTA-5024 TaxID=316330 RepID=UPI0003DB8506|nr:universal stress protein [Microbispora sp. ATCC PTA-5024]ETK32940.1 universal stress protein UspA [Microbispora sp. ATCC PTA-5024]
MIVAGVDGSRAGFEAAAWAAREAAMRHVPLRVVHVLPAWVCEVSEGDRLGGVAAWMRVNASTVLAEALAWATPEALDVPVDSALLPGDPRQALIEAAGDADLLVLGNHGLGGFRGLLLGSVAYGTVAHATGDVVVVRETPRSPYGSVVAGVDGSPLGRRVVEFAMAEAALHGAPLRAVHAWSPSQAGSVLTPGPGELGEEQSEARLLGEALAGLRERYPDVRVIDEVVRAHPVEALRAASDGAELLVVGSHGGGRFSGLILGSVSQAMLYHATCPLAVVKLRGP